MASARSWTNPVLWVLALVLINVLWSNVAQQEAPNEINAFNNFEPVRELTVTSVFGSAEPLPASLKATFSSSSLDEGNISFSLLLDNQTTVFSWSGLLSDEPPSWKGELEPGTYTVLTEVDEGIEVDQVLVLQPFATIQLQGHAVLSTLLVAVAVAEQAVRGWISKRMPAPSEPRSSPAPFKAASLGSENDTVWNDNDSPWREPLR